MKSFITLGLVLFTVLAQADQFACVNYQSPSEEGGQGNVIRIRKLSESLDNGVNYIVTVFREGGERFSKSVFSAEFQAVGTGDVSLINRAYGAHDMTPELDLNVVSAVGSPVKIKTVIFRKGVMRLDDREIPLVHFPSTSPAGQKCLNGQYPEGGLW